MNRVGEQWHKEFRRIAKEKGVSEEKLDELEGTHLKPGANEQLMKALKVLMVGTPDECVDVATELAEQQHLDATIFTAMADYAMNNSYEFDSVMETKANVTESAHQESWKTVDDWAPAKNITEQLARPDGEGAETYKYAKAEVDHMRETGGVLTCNRQSPEVHADLKGAPPL